MHHPSELAGFPAIVALPIQWGDQDAFGHVNNTIPFRWFESSRVVYLEQSGLSHMMSGQGIGPIVASVKCNFRRQMNYPDTVHVGAKLVRMGGSSIVIEHRVFSEKLTALAADGESVVVAFDYQKQRPVRIPEAMRNAIQRLEAERHRAGE